MLPVSNNFNLVREWILDNFIVLNSWGHCFMALRMVSFGECSMWTWKKKIFCHCLRYCLINVCWIRLVDSIILIFISLLTFCLLVPSITEREAVKSHITYLSIFLFIFVNFSIMSFEALVLVAYILMTVMSFWWVYPFTSWNVPLYSHLYFLCEVYFVWY